jgi:hypothetical protein
MMEGGGEEAEKIIGNATQEAQRIVEVRLVLAEFDNQGYSAQMFLV